MYILESPGHYYHTPRDLFCGSRELAILEATGRPVAPLERAASAKWFPSAVSISPYGYRGGLIYTGQDDDAVELAEAVAFAADSVCQQEGVRIATYFHLNETDDLTWIMALARQNARITIVGADCNLRVRWRSLEEYFRWLGPRGRRQRSKHRQVLKTANMRWQAMTLGRNGLDSGMSRAVAALFASTARKHSDTGPPTSLYESLLCSWPCHRLLLLGETMEGKKRSALLVFAKEKRLYPKFFGTIGVRDDYFFLTYSWLLDRAITEGACCIEYGGGSHQAKLLRGAHLRWLVAAVRVYEKHLSACLADMLPHYETAKFVHFSELASRYQVDHTPPARPITLNGDGLLGLS